MKNFVRSFAAFFRVCFLSFIRIDKNHCSISNIWILANTLKVLMILKYSWLLLDEENHIQKIFMISEVSYIIVIWTFMVTKRNTIAQALNSVFNLAQKMPIDDQKICEKSKKKCCWALVVFQFPILYFTIYHILIRTQDQSEALVYVPVIYLNCLVHFFLGVFFLASEFLLVCLKSLNKRLAVALKLESATLLNPKTSEYQKAQSYGKLQNTIESTVYFYQKIYKISLEFGEIFSILALLSLLFLMSKVLIQVRVSFTLIAVMKIVLFSC